MASRAAGDLRALAWSLRALAWAHRSRWDHGTADRLLAEALRLGRRSGDGLLVVHVRMTRHAVRQEMGRAAAARRDLDAALEALVDAPEGEERSLAAARIRMQQATSDANAGRMERAEPRLRELARDPWLTDTDRYKLLNNLGFVIAHRGAYDEALEWVEQAVEVAARLGPAALAPVLQSRAWIRVQSGRLALGLRDFDEAARVYADAGLPLGEYYAEYADTMADLRLLPEASTAARRAVEEFEAAHVPFMGAEARLRLAQISLLEGDLEAARVTAETAVAALDRQRRGAWRDRALLVGVEARRLAGEATATELAAVRRAAARLERGGNLPGAVQAHLVAGRLAMAEDRREVALTELGRAGRLASGGAVLVRVRGRLAVALAARVADRHTDVLAACRAGLRDLAGHRASLPTMELRALASGHGAELGELGLGVVLRQSSPARVLEWMERTRAAALLTRVPAEPTTSPRARDRRQRLASGFDTTTRAGATAEVVADVEEQVRERASSWTRDVVQDERGVERAQVFGLGPLRDALGDRVLVEYGRHGGRLVAVVVRRSRSRVVELGQEAEVDDQLRALFFALRRLANPRASASSDAARASADLRVDELHRMLVAPLGLRPDDELVVVPAGLLHGVPWSALHEGPVAMAPSATLWARTAEAATVRDGGTVLVAGPELDGAREEVDALAALHPAATVLGPQESTAEVVLGALAEADLGHLACHGALRADNPMFSSLALADGPVTVQELHAAGAAPRRLVLASCHGGADVAYAGGEVLGLVSAMLAQGTQGVVASIAAIPDVEAVDLMVGLHRRLRSGDTLAHALHAARAGIDRQTPGGYVNWCTFGAHGAA
ncbi:CHAT domain-containing protein [Cellulomonas soli]|uniref:CHAT domain-containing protein n=1 Tax=Cellulomonas soli TaxID=931535 RepID=A0A512P972_9CELL|nr:CHAT domain-containing protein [Cellulomonas soli]NYI57962.1 tetratricopeptide (TPR) repeat protein [Cellulomonas soli]GEP67745.1 CHAT domain-containing protein [Cellulomonas soli]